MTPPNVSLIFIMVCFWITMWLVYRFLIVPVGRVLAERGGRIDDAAAQWQATNDDYLAATQRLETEMADAARAAAQVRGEHRQRALEERQKALEAARSEADGRLGEALGRLEADADQARTELGRRARELARLFATQLLEREVSR
jgi:F-type H+-transporting ATPase subunit b